MFEGVPDQFHHFPASRTSLPHHLPPTSFPPLHHASSTTTTTATTATFDPYITISTPATISHHQQVPFQPNFLHQALHPSTSPPSTTKNHDDKEQNNMVAAAMNLEIEIRDRSIQESIDPWSNDEVLSLLRIRSSMEHNWFPESTNWDHVSRKLAELGFKRSAEKCKEKFEEESRYFNNNINNNYSKNNYRVFGEFEELYNHGDNDDNNNNNPNSQENILQEKNKTMDMPSQDEQEDSRIDQTVGDNPTEDKVEKSKNKKRKRKNKKFEMFKGFCEDIISKIMVQQQEMHNKLLEDMVKRDEEKIAREEAWKKQEMDRINKDLELRAQEQALAGDRQATLINFLKNFSSSSSSSTTSSSNSITILEEKNNVVQDLLKGTKISNLSAPSSVAMMVPQNPNPSTQNYQETHQNPNFLNTQNKPSIPTSLSKEIAQKKASSDHHEKEDVGKRWPKDEVLALINLRGSLYNSNEEKDQSTIKAPLWERISQGMLELGYKRSAKRCKEKWENINKYFRKNKDVNKKRSVDSRTCPYFHQLSTLYNQGTLVVPPPPQPHSEGGSGKSSIVTSPENHSAAAAGSRLNSSSQNGSSKSTMHVAEEGEKNNLVGLDFEF